MKWAAPTVLLMAAVVGGLWGRQVGQSSAGPPSGIRIWLQPGVASAAAEATARQFALLQAAIDADFPRHANPVITIRFYATHAAFGMALHRLEGMWPQRRGDNVGNIVENVLPLGPNMGLLNHNLAHVYTEWVLDRLTGNAADRQPHPAWLYDGLAEYEADRRSERVPCRLSGGYPLPLARIATPQQWWRIRATIYQGFEYCEARDAAARIVRRLGWRRVEDLLRKHETWATFARALGAYHRQNERCLCTLSSTD